MGFRAKLSRLGPGAPIGASERGAVREGSGLGAPDDQLASVDLTEPSAHAFTAPALDGSPQSVGAGPEVEVLEGLRARMRAMLGRLPQAEIVERRENADPSTTELPFMLEETEHGPVCVRRERLPRSYRVGRMAVSEAIDGDPEVLGLLALDPAVAGASPRGALYFDTETTGLGAGAGTCAFLVGLAWFDDAGELVLEQLFLRQPSEERALLELLRQRVEAATLLVSFNGKSFDWPLLESRYVMNRSLAPPTPPHLDLLHVGRRLHKARLGSCKLKNLEAEVLGFVRDEDIDGAECPPRYAHFLRTGDAEALRPVVDHNLWDVASMAALVALYGEPLEQLHRDDLLGLAKTYQRARELDRALEVADVAVARGGGPDALESRARIAKARGDKARALADFEQLAQEIDDPGVRLELAKLYEHHLKEPGRALDWVAGGTGENDEALERRRARLQRKVVRGQAVAEAAATSRPKRRARGRLPKAAR